MCGDSFQACIKLGRRSLGLTSIVFKADSQVAVNLVRLLGSSITQTNSSRNCLYVVHANWNAQVQCLHIYIGARPCMEEVLNGQFLTIPIFGWVLLLQDDICGICTPPPQCSFLLFSSPFVIKQYLKLQICIKQIKLLKL